MYVSRNITVNVLIPRGPQRCQRIRPMLRVRGSNYLKLSPRAKRWVSNPWEYGPDAIRDGVTVLLIIEVFRAHDLGSLVTSLLWNDMVRFEIVTKQSGIWVVSLEAGSPTRPDTG